MSLCSWRIWVLTHTQCIFFFHSTHTRSSCTNLTFHHKVVWFLWFFLFWREKETWEGGVTLVWCWDTSLVVFVQEFVVLYRDSLLLSCSSSLLFPTHDSWMFVRKIQVRVFVSPQSSSCFNDVLTLRASHNAYIPGSAMLFPAVDTNALEMTETWEWMKWNNQDKGRWVLCWLSMLHSLQLLQHFQPCNLCPDNNKSSGAFRETKKKCRQMLTFQIKCVESCVVFECLSDCNCTSISNIFACVQQSINNV